MTNEYDYDEERQIEDERNSRVATEAEADREYAHNVGQDNPTHAWILSDRDVWYPNPFYTGPRVPHPESDYDTVEEANDYRATKFVIDDDIPF